LLPVVYSNLIPDALVRVAIRTQLHADLEAVKRLSCEELVEKKTHFINELRTMDIAIAQTQANEQHYEVPDAFYRQVLGPRLKYSAGYWPSSRTTLEESEDAMLELYCARADLQDGMNLIDLGCGWGRYRHLLFLCIDAIYSTKRLHVF
jgi:cyclopropane-fatty-acyl-phospholipid synthase